MTMTEFLKFLQKHCKSSIREGAHLLSEDRGQNIAYENIGSQIDVFLTDYAEHRKLTKQAEDAFIAAIETDQRRQFDDPVELIEHIYDMARHQPFFDAERISLAAIQGFCSDFIHRRNVAVKADLLQHAPF